MLYMHEMADDTFVMLQADWPAGQARQLVERLQATHVIIHRREPWDYYYLYSRGEALDRLRSTGEDVTVETAFNLHESDATPTMDAYADAEGAPGRVVVVDEGQVTGFYDVMAAASLDFTARGEGTKSGTRGLRPPAALTRSLVAEFPERVALEETVSLLVSLSALGGPETPGAPALPVAVPPGTTVDVVVQAKRGFELTGSAEGSLTVVDEDETLPLQFKLRASALGLGKIRVLAFQEGQALGAITLAPVVVAAGAVVDGGSVTHEGLMAPASARQPDLRLLIEEDRRGGEVSLTIRLTTTDPDEGLVLKPFGPVPLRTSPREFFDSFFQDIEETPLGTGQQRAIAERRLGNKGAFLFETLFPQDLQALLWSLKDRIKTVQILSEEPWIPWELCKLQGTEEGRVVSGPFLCEAFSVTRWNPEWRQRNKLTLNKMALVVPQDSGLPYAAGERDYVLSLADGGREVERIPATFLDLISSLEAGEHDGWHFTGHGSFRGETPDRAAMVLEQGDELRPEDLSGTVANLGLARPLVFLNACQIGRSALSLTDIGGWAARFLNAGAAAFIGAYWSIFDKPAHDFAQEFYSRLLGGMAIGEAVQGARLAIKPAGDPTWLAYTVFADPLAMVEQG